MFQRMAERGGLKKNKKNSREHYSDVCLIFQRMTERGEEERKQQRALYWCLPVCSREWLKEVKKSEETGGRTKPSLLKALIRLFGFRYLLLGFIVFIEVSHVPL